MRPPACRDEAYSCSCVRPLGHEEPHECECGGQWRWDRQPGDYEAFRAVRMPGVLVGPIEEGGR